MSLRWSLLGAALLSGVLWTLAWPAVGGLFPLAFVAWLPLLWAEERWMSAAPGERPRRFLPYVYLGCLLWNATTTWWLGAVDEPWSTRIISGGFPMLANSLLMVIPWALKRSVWRNVGRKQAIWGFIAFWLTFERLHHDWDLTWPWLTLGNVFAGYPSWTQWYEYTGVLGGSLWVLVMNHLIHEVWRVLPQMTWRSAVTVLTVLVLPLLVSLVIYRTYQPKGVPLEVVVVQPNIDPYGEKFGGVDPLVQLDRMMDQASEVMTDSTALVVFPETALQENATIAGMHEGEFILEGLWENDLSDSRSARRIVAFLQEHPQAAVLTGMSSAYLYGREERPPATARALGESGRHYDAFNAAMLLEADGRIEPYHKSKLVAGVEIMPFERVLAPLVGRFAIDLGGTTGSLRGQQEREVMTTRDGRVNAAPVICYESVFAEHVAAHVRNGATLLVIMTNDGWWGESPGYRQHLDYGTLRAIETRRDIARSANTGISCFIDQRGVIHQATDWWVPAAVRSTVLCNEELTFFVRHGDLIGRTAMWVGALLWLLAMSRYLRRSRAVIPQ
ncbi:MAG: apolipoprotein N-acyltransferase [Flavobacteriales bacterium]|nr:apolipoprotein N-acyltransferase [Flavobacteriales bacterium]